MSSGRPLSVLAVTLRYPPYVAGGYELLTRDAVDELRARGHTVSVLAGRGSRLAGVDGVLPWLQPELDGGDLFERSFRGSNLERFRLHFLRLSNYRATRAAIERTGAEIVLFFNLGLVSLAPILAARHAGIPTLGYAADPWPTNHWLRAWRADGRSSAKGLRLELLTRLWRAFRELVGMGPLLACSRHLAEELVADGIPPEDVTVLHLGVPPDVEASAAQAEIRRREAGEPLRAVCISSLWHGKGQQILLAALGRARVRGAPIEIVLAGAGEDAGYRRELESLVAALELDGAVRFAGALDRPALSGLLGSAHVLVMPSLWSEPFGLATLEGMAYGLAVLTSDAGALPEIVTPGESGLVVPAGDEAALADALVRLERDEELRRRLARDARRRAHDVLSHARFVDGLEEALGRAAGMA